MKLSKEAEQLKKLDPILSKIILHNLKDRGERGTVYESLLRAIISQQISVSAANSIRTKFLKLFNKKNITEVNLKFPTSKKLLNTPDEVLKSCGLSIPKISYLKNVAQHFALFPPFKGAPGDFALLSDSEIINDLTKIKGVGEWTAEMILIFTLGRKDVFSYKDLALVKPILELYKIKKEKYTPKKLKEKVLKITEKWSPHRSLACLYLWEYSNSKKIRKSK